MSEKRLLGNVKEYLGFRAAPAGELDALLSQLVVACGREVYLDGDLLSRAMEAEGAHPTQILQTRIMTQVTGFSQLLEGKGWMAQSDLDRFVTNALTETGLSRAKVLELAAAISASLGVSFRYTPSPEGEESAAQGQAFVIPASLYAQELREAEQALATGKVTPETRDRLEHLSAAGVPQAKALLGRLYLRHQPDEPQLGVDLLEEAAAQGSAAACAALGDYYFEQDDLDAAYRCYTGYGALALTQPRQDRLAHILARKRANRRTLLYSLILAGVLTVLMLLAPGRTLFAPHLILALLCALGMGGVLTLAILRFRAAPNRSPLWVPCALAGFWAVHTAARLLF